MRKGTFKFSEVTNITEVGISAYPSDDNGEERIEFITPLVAKANEDILMVMARRILELEEEVIDLQASVYAMS
jgi:hypothetical protein